MGADLEAKAQPAHQAKWDMQDLRGKLVNPALWASLGKKATPVDLDLKVSPDREVAQDRKG